MSIRVADVKLCTGSPERRDCVRVRCEYDPVSYPIDAPERMPAGSVNSTDWIDFRYHPIPGQTYVTRGV